MFVRNILSFLSNVISISYKGVLIPSSNKDELILMPEVEKAIEDGDFHIYIMDTLEDAIETLILRKDETLKDFYISLNEELNKYKNKKEDK